MARLIAPLTDQEVPASIARDQELVDALTGSQPVDPDLSSIAALDSSTAGALVTDGAGWVRKTYAQLKTALGLVKADVGLANVDNTSDANKPVSILQEARFAVLEDTIYDVRNSGAVLNGVTDDTAAIQSALTTSGLAFVPEGVARIDGTLKIGIRQSLFLHPKAELRRVAAAVSTDPIVQFDANYGRLLGNGLLVTEKASPLGILHFGPLLSTTSRNVLWCHSDVRVAGLKAIGNVGIRFNSTTSGTGFGTYVNRADGLVSTVGTAVLMVAEANANEVNIDTYQILQYVYHCDDVVEFAILGGFVHNSADVTVLKFNNATYASVVGLRAEPGGNAKPYEFTGCTGCYVQMANNTALAGSDNDTTGSNTFILREKIQWDGLSPHAVEIHPNRFPAENTGWNNTQANSASFSGATNSSGGAVDALIGWDVQMRRGTWRIDLCHFSGTNRGIYTVEIANVTEGGTVGSFTTLTAIDGYEAAGTHKRSSVLGLAIATSGRKRLRLRMATKNASSSSFIGSFEHLAMIRTGA